jgi:hypothetical protein
VHQSWDLMVAEKHMLNNCGAGQIAVVLLHSQQLQCYASLQCCCCAEHWSRLVDEQLMCKCSPTMMYTSTTVDEHVLDGNLL